MIYFFYLGFAWAGFSVNHLDVAPQYAAILMGISNTIGTIPGIISPAITGYLVEDKSVASWQHVFVITAFVYAIGKINAFKIYEQSVYQILLAFFLILMPLVRPIIAFKFKLFWVFCCCFGACLTPNSKYCWIYLNI